AALAQRAGGDLDAGGVAVLRMAGADAVELAEALDVVEADGGDAERLAVPVDALYAGQVQHRIEQHAGVARREDEAVAVRPAGIGRVVAPEPGPERVGDRR